MSDPSFAQGDVDLASPVTGFADFDEQLARLRAVIQCLSDIHTRLSAKGEMASSEPEASDSSFLFFKKVSAPDFKAIVQGEIANSKLRDSVFQDVRLGDPVWNILLELFDAQVSGRALSIKAVCYASGAPMTTGLRYLEQLVALNYVEKCPDPSDGRRTLLHLTAMARSKVMKVLDRESRPRFPVDR